MPLCCQQKRQLLLPDETLKFNFFFSEFSSTASEVIEKYFHLGYDYKTITNMLQVYHGITMSVRTLKRRLQSYNLVKRKNSVNEDLIRNVIRREMQGPGQLAGYRKMWHILRIKHHVHAPRWLVAQILRELDPDASKARKRNKLHRRIYHSHRPNQCWHSDGEIIIFNISDFTFFCPNHLIMPRPLFQH